MGQLVLFSVLVLILGLTLGAWSNPTEHSHLKDAEKFMNAIERSAEKISLDRFEGDPVLLQSLDRVNSRTYYKLPANETQRIIFRREVLDAGHEVVVISDEKESKSSNKIFVVLRKNPNQTKAYYATYAYVRAFMVNDDPQEAVNIDGKQMRIEWDTWTDRGKRESEGRSFTWNTCSGSIFMACKTTNKVNEDVVDYTSEIDNEEGVTVVDKGGGVIQPQVRNPQWGLNLAAVADKETSFTGSSGAAEPDLIDTIDVTGTIEGGDDVTEDFNFFEDLDDNDSDSRTIEGAGISETDFLGRIGWQTQDVPEQELHTQEIDDGEPFVGFGTCPYIKSNSSQLNDINDPAAAVEFYLIALRTQCSKGHILKLLRLFNKGLLTVNGDKSLSIPTDNPLITTSKLTAAETTDFCRAFETSMFSHVYTSELRQPSLSLTDPIGDKIARSVFTMISMSLHTLSESRQTVPGHYILLIRNLLHTLKSSGLKVRQDYDRIMACEQCIPAVKEQAANNVVSIQAIQLFIIRGLSVVEKGVDPYVAYENFFKKHSKMLRNIAKL